MTSLSARPIVAFARRPGPKRFTPALTPRARATGPLTTTKGAEPPVLVIAPCRLYAGSAIASSAARTTGMYSGRQPARTALMAAFSTVTVRRRVASRRSTSSGCRRAASRNSWTRAAVAGTTGRPSVQPRSKHVSTASAQPEVSTSRDMSGIGAPSPTPTGRRGPRPASNTMRPGRVSSRGAPLTGDRRGDTSAPRNFSRARTTRRGRHADLASVPHATSVHWCLRDPGRLGGGAGRPAPVGGPEAASHHHRDQPVTLARGGSRG